MGRHGRCSVGSDDVVGGGAASANVDGAGSAGIVVGVVGTPPPVIVVATPLPLLREGARRFSQAVQHVSGHADIGYTKICVLNYIA